MDKRIITIGIGGFMGNGKSTVAQFIADIIKNTTPHAVLIEPFAKGVKDTAYEMGWDGNKDARGRRLLQLIGTECGRKCIGEDVWVNYWKKQINIWAQSKSEDYLFVIADDLRFMNELELIQTYGYAVLIEGRVKPSKPRWLRHASEKGLPTSLYDYLIFNHGKNINELHSNTYHLVQNILKKESLRG